jgi:hypothetical protein
VAPDLPFTPGGQGAVPRHRLCRLPLARSMHHQRPRSQREDPPDERLLAELRQRQLTPHGRARLRERVAVEHTLAHIGHWQGRRACYLGQRKNLFDLRRCAGLHNLHVIARAPWATQQAA